MILIRNATPASVEVYVFIFISSTVTKLSGSTITTLSLGNIFSLNGTSEDIMYFFTLFI